jgi:hypothetical protein
MGTSDYPEILPEGWLPSWKRVSDRIWKDEAGEVHLSLVRCPNCGTEAAVFICSTPGCPVNGGAAHG